MNKLFAIIAGAVLALAIAILALPSFVDWDRYKPIFASRISGLAGEPVRIGGSANFRLLPQPAFMASDVSIGEGGASGSVDRIEAELSAWPLLRGRVEVRSVVLVGLSASMPIERLRPGNLAGLGWPAGGEASSLQDRITVEGGTLQLTDAGGAALGVLQDVNLAVSRSDAGRGYEARGDFHLAGRPVTVEVNTGAEYAGEVPISVQFRLPAFDTWGTFHGRLAAATASGVADLEGEARVEGRDLGGLLASLLLQDGPSAVARVSPGEKFSLRSEVAVVEDAVRLENASAEVSGVLARGAVALEPSPGGLRADAEFRVGRVDLDRALPAEGAFDPEPVWRAAQAVAGTGVSGSLGLSAEAALVRGGIVKDVELALSIEQGVITIDQLSAALPGAADLLVSGQVLPSESEPRFELSVEGKAVDLRRTVQWAGYSLASVPPGRLRSASFTVLVASDGKTASLSQIQAEVDETSIEGGITFSLGERPAFGVSLAVDRLDWDDYFADAGSVPDASADLVALGEVKKRSRLLAGFDANVRLRLGQMTVGGVEIHGAVLDALLFEGRLDLRELGYDEALGTNARLSGRFANLGDEPAGTIGFRAEIADLPETLRRLSVPVASELDHIRAVAVQGSMSGSPSDLAVKLDLEGGGFAVELIGDIQDSLKDLRYQIEATARTAVSGPDEDGTSLTFRANGGPSSAVVRDLRLESGGTSVTGSVAAEWTSIRPVVQASFRSGRLDLGPLQLLEEGGQQRTLPRRLLQLAGLAAVEPDIDFDLLRRFDADLSLAAASLDLSPSTRLEGVELAAGLASGVLDVRRLEGRYAGGTFGITGRLAGPDRPLVSASVRFEGVETDALDLSSNDISLTGGTFDLAFEIDPDANAAASQGSSRGRGALEARNGVITISPFARISTAETLQMPEQLPFSSLKALFALGRDRLVAPELVLATGHGEAEGTIEMDFAGRSIDGHVTFTDGALAGTVMDLSGPLQRPRVRLAAASDR